VVYLRDGTGEALRIEKPFSHWEMHWRDKKEPRMRVTLPQKTERYSGVLAFLGSSPELWLYPIDLKPILLGNPKKGLRLKLTIRYKPSKDIGIKSWEIPTIEQAYRIKGSRFAKSGYRARRVWFRALFWR
jgi:hypothetical protein